MTYYTHYNCPFPTQPLIALTSPSCHLGSMAWTWPSYRPGPTSATSAWEQGWTRRLCNSTLPTTSCRKSYRVINFIRDYGNNLILVLCNPFIFQGRGCGSPVIEAVSESEAVDPTNLDVTYEGNFTVRNLSSGGAANAGSTSAAGLMYLVFSNPIDIGALTVTSDVSFFKD